MFCYHKAREILLRLFQCVHLVPCWFSQAKCYDFPAQPLPLQDTQPKGCLSGKTSTSPGKTEHRMDSWLVQQRSEPLKCWPRGIC